MPVLEKATTLAPKHAQAWATLGWAYFGLKDAANFKAAGGKARVLGYKEPTFLTYLQRIEAGEASPPAEIDARSRCPPNKAVSCFPCSGGCFAPPRPPRE